MVFPSLQLFLRYIFDMPVGASFYSIHIEFTYAESNSIGNDFISTPVDESILNGNAGILTTWLRKYSLIPFLCGLVINVGGVFFHIL